MKRMKLKTVSYDDCTLGRLWFDSFQCFTLELPWKNNEKNQSCIPAGVYECIIIDSPKNGECILVDGVDGRSHIQIHSGNYTSQIQGCILPGSSIKFLNRDQIPDVTSSRDTLSQLMLTLPDDEVFELEIERS